MQTAQLNSTELEYEAVGSGEPVLLIHGGVLAGDTFLPLTAESRLADGRQTIRYHRRGYAGSARATSPFGIADHAADAKALLAHLGISRAHVVGHSFGGAIALQLALDAPDLVASLAVLEPALAAAVPPPPAWEEVIGVALGKFHAGDLTGALDAFFTHILAPGYRPMLDKNVPGGFEQAVADIQTPFSVELEALLTWRFTADDAARIRQPTLAVLGDDSGPMFSDGQKVLRQWIPHAQEFRVPQTHHALQFMSPRVIAEGLADFLEEHPL